MAKGEVISDLLESFLYYYDSLEMILIFDTAGLEISNIERKKYLTSKRLKNFKERVSALYLSITFEDETFDLSFHGHGIKIIKRDSYHVVFVYKSSEINSTSEAVIRILDTVI